MIVILQGKEVKVDEGARVGDIAHEKHVFAARMNGQLVDLSAELCEGASIQFVDFSHEDGKQVYWHSASHIMAMAVKMLFPHAKLAIGPSIDQGFYYDFGMEKPFSGDDVQGIEEKMREIIQKKIAFERVVMRKDEAITLFSQKNETYKVELLQTIDDEQVTLYRNEDFIDLCRGPHVPHTGMIHAFKLLSVAGAYWRGDVDKPMLSRIYGIAFPEPSDLDAYLEKLEDARQRDHRKLGNELGLFSIFEEAGAGLVYWHPKGSFIKRAIEEYWIKEHLASGYQLVSTPHIARGHLWHQSGHYDYYRDNMFIVPVDKEEYILKPMNCPGHILIFKAKVRSYKDLPLKFAELGQVYRHELSGTLHGLLRVRGITIDDGHIFCQPQQIEDEIVKVIELTMRMLKKFGFENFKIDLSVRDEHKKDKYLGTDEEWERAEQGLISALQRTHLEYEKQAGEAVFYGPKIDIKLLDALGREWQATTIQFDFNLPKRLKIEYMDQDGRLKEVVAIHRAIYGSLERFIGCLIEHYKGSFPFWLAPVQMVVLPITDKQTAYAEGIRQECQAHGLRVEVNSRSERISQRIRDAEVQKIPYILIIGKKEVEHATVAVRKHGKGDIGEMQLKEFLSILKDEQGGDN